MSISIIQEIAIPYIHPKVDPAHVQPNGKLLTDLQIEFVKTYLNIDGKYTKAESQSNYSIITQDGKHYAIYLGVNHKQYGKKGKALGVGSFGNVKLAQDLVTGEWLVLKVQEPSIVSANEEFVLKQIEEVIKTDKNAQSVAFKKQSNIKNKELHYLLMKLARGINLFDLATHERQFSLLTWLEITIKIIDSVAELHKKGFLHADIKLENIIEDLVADSSKLIDFGFSLKMNADGNKKIFTMFGTPGYMAPELFSQRVITYTKKADVYSLGVVLGYLLHLGKQNEVTGRIDFLDQFKESNPRIAEPQIREKILDFIKLMTYQNNSAWDKGACKRPTLEQVKTFFVNIRDNLDVKYKTKKIGILNIDEYEKAKTDLALYEKLIQRLRQFEEIWLIHASVKKDVWYYAKIKSELEKKGVIVQNQLLHHVDRRFVINEIPSFLNAKYPRQQRHYFSIDNTGINRLSRTKKRSNENTADSHGFFAKRPARHMISEMINTKQTACLGR